MNKSMLVSLLLLLALYCSAQNLQVKDGDIIFQTSRSSQSKAIQLATRSKWSHMGIIITVKNESMVFEAVEPVKFTPLKQWIKRGEQGKFVLKRLKDSEKHITAENIQKMKKLAESFKGKHYDHLFEWSDKKMYCSEIVWKIYDRILGIQLAELQRLKDFDLQSPVVQKKMKERYGDALPLNEPVISPEQIFQSELLQTIYSD